MSFIYKIFINYKAYNKIWIPSLSLICKRLKFKLLNISHYFEMKQCSELTSTLLPLLMSSHYLLMLWELSHCIRIYSYSIETKYLKLFLFILKLNTFCTAVIPQFYRTDLRTSWFVLTSYWSYINFLFTLIQLPPKVRNYDFWFPFLFLSDDFC